MRHTIPEQLTTFIHHRGRTRNLAIVNRLGVSSAHKVTKVNFQGGGKFSWGRKHMGQQWWQPQLEA